jgi:hypothetical protein
VSVEPPERAEQQRATEQRPRAEHGDAQELATRNEVVGIQPVRELGAPFRDRHAVRLLDAHRPSLIAARSQDPCVLVRLGA